MYCNNMMQQPPYWNYPPQAGPTVSIKEYKKFKKYLEEMEEEKNKKEADKKKNEKKPPEKRNFSIIEISMLMLLLSPLTGPAMLAFWKHSLETLSTTLK